MSKHSIEMDQSANTAIKAKSKEKNATTTSKNESKERVESGNSQQMNQRDMPSAQKTKIASAAYLNSVQFNFGIEHSGLINAELTLTTPADCASKLSSGEVDIALIPVGALPLLGEEGTNYEIVTSHCIGASGAVRTVVLLSDDELKDIKRVWLDPHSRTSVKLLTYLCKEHFKISPKWLILNDISRVEHPKEGDAFLLIGDKVFDHEGIFEYSYDLAEEWQNHTSLPFVFAVWCCKCDTSEEMIEQLEEALTWGVERTFEAMQALRPEIEIEDGYRYLTENIDTIFDNQKRKAMELFRSNDCRIELSKEE